VFREQLCAKGAAEVPAAVFLGRGAGLFGEPGSALVLRLLGGAASVSAAGFARLACDVLTGTPEAKAELYFGDQLPALALVEGVLRALSAEADGAAASGNAAACARIAEMVLQDAPPAASRILQRHPLLELAMDHAVASIVLGLEWARVSPQNTSPLPPMTGADADAGQLLAPIERALLHTMVPADHRVAWTPVFSSQRDGASFAALRRGLGTRLSTVIVIRDSHGHVFGGYALHAWEPQATFFGNECCFIFSLQPRTRIYPASGRKQTNKQEKTKKQKQKTRKN
jgi:hypothetical protein